MSLSSDSLEAFVTFAETLNFTRAAERLHISQPALHVKIKKLAEELGVPLYLKDGRGLVLTPYGTELARFGRESAHQMSSFLEQLIRGRETQPVVLAAGAGAYLYLLGDAIARFQKRDGAPLRLLTADRQRTLELVSAGEAHLGVTVLDSVPVEMTATLLATFAPVLVTQTDHRLANRRRITVRDLEGEQLIVPMPGQPHRESIARVFDTHGVSWKVALETTGWDLIVQFVRLGLGVAVINGCCTIPRGLKSIAISDFPTTKYYLVSRRSLAFSPSQQLLAELIRAHILQ